MMNRKFKVGDIVDARDYFTGQVEKSAMVRTLILDGDGVFTGSRSYLTSELTLIRAVDETAKTYKGQFEVGNAPSFNKMLDSLPF